MEHNSLSNLHTVLLELLDEFVRICEENNFAYFLTAGTLLGAIRHKGFIPWDDDIDIAMPRDDYERFLDYYETINDTKYYILSNRCAFNTFYHYITFTKFCKKGTLFAEKNREEKDYSGIFIDIYPYDNCVLFFLPLQTFLIKFSLRLYRFKTFDNIPRNRIKAQLKKFFSPFIPLKFCFMLYDISIKLYSVFNKNNTKYISFFSGRCSFKKETHRLSRILPLTKVLFEDKLYNAPNNCDMFLKNFFGNYMKMPSIKKRRTHANHIIFNKE